MKCHLPYFVLSVNALRIARDLFYKNSRQYFEKVGVTQASKGNDLRETL